MSTLDIRKHQETVAIIKFADDTDNPVVTRIEKCPNDEFIRLHNQAYSIRASVKKTDINDLIKALRYVQEHWN